MKNKQARSSSFFGFSLSALGITAFLLVSFFLELDWASATTIGSDISTTGRFIINKTSTDTAGSVDLDLTSSTNAVIGEDLIMNLQGNIQGTGQKITIAGTGADLSGSSAQIALQVILSGSSSATSGGTYMGSLVTSQGSTANAGQYLGYGVIFNTNNGGASMTGTGDVTGFNATIAKTAGTGNMNGLTASLTRSSLTADSSGRMRGVEVELFNTAASIGEFTGMRMRLDVSGGASNSYGLWIQEDGASGLLADGVRVENDITDAIDASDVEVVNALNAGPNHIISMVSTSGTDQPSVSSCGGSSPSASLSGSDTAGRVTIGSGSVTSNNNATKYAVSTTISALTITSDVSMGGQIVNYICFG